jgi:hypothetical protein
MGPHLSRHLQKFRHAQEAKCNSFVPHRLAYLYDRIKDSVATLKEREPAGDVISFLELSLFQYLVEDIKTDPAWNSISQELHEKGSFVHMMTLLAFVKLQRMRGTIARIVPAKNSEAKSADAFLATSLHIKVDVEIKSPELLWTRSALTTEQAARVIKSAWRKSKGQIGERPSILVIGGLYLPNAVLELLASEAQKFLEIKRNKHVALIVLMSVTSHFDKPIFEDGALTIGPETSMAPRISLHHVHNPHYEGVIKFFNSDREVPGQKKLNDSVEISY